MRLFHFLKSRAALLAEFETLRAANRKLTEERDTAQLVSWMRCPPGLRAENEALRREIAKLLHALDTAILASWIRQPKEAPAPHRCRSEPHPVRPGRHREDAPTEIGPRAGARREPT